MDGLRQIAVVAQGDGWNLLGLDAEGRVWYGSPRRTPKGRSLTWALMDESPEEDPEAEPAAALPPVEGAGRTWPSRPRP
jgi:hypothetical protein